MANSKLSLATAASFPAERYGASAGKMFASPPLALRGGAGQPARRNLKPHHMGLMGFQEVQTSGAPVEENQARGNTTTA